MTKTRQLSSLNPCFSGGWSRSGLHLQDDNSRWKVLILVLVEDGLGEELNAFEKATVVGLNPCFSGGWSRRPPSGRTKPRVKKGLNPCFSGGWSRRVKDSLDNTIRVLS